MIDFIAFVRVMQHYYFIHLINLINFHSIKHLWINQMSLSHHHNHRYCIWNTSSIVSVGLRNSRHFVALISSDALRYEVIMMMMLLFMMIVISWLYSYVSMYVVKYATSKLTIVMITFLSNIKLHWRYDKKKILPLPVINYYIPHPTHIYRLKASSKKQTISFLCMWVKLRITRWRSSGILIRTYTHPVLVL